MHRNGYAQGWGIGETGALGTGEMASSSVAVNVSAPLPGPLVTSISSNEFHSCATTSDQRFYCWGKRLPNGTATDVNEATPVLIEYSAFKVLQVAATYLNTCIVGSTLRVYCWGNNANAQNGNGVYGWSSDNYGIPAEVLLPAGMKFRRVVGKQISFCALSEDGQVYCWGYNDYNQTTSPDQDLNVPTPVLVVSLPGLVQELFGSTYHFCARLLKGSIYCWGIALHGVLGDGKSYQHSNGAVQMTVVPAEQVVLLDMTASATYVVLRNGSIWGFGEGYFGAAGVETSATPIQLPIDVAVGEIVGLSCGGSTLEFAKVCCLHLATQPSRCWGDRSLFQIGNGGGKTGFEPVPVAVVNG